MIFKYCNEFLNGTNNNPTCVMQKRWAGNFRQRVICLAYGSIFDSVQKKTNGMNLMRPVIPKGPNGLKKGNQSWKEQIVE